MGTEILSGLNMFVGAHYTENYVDSTPSNDTYEGTGGITYALGPIAIGGAVAGHVTGKTTTATDVDWYKNNMYGISFNINDDLSVSYGKHESRQGFVNPNAGETVTLDVESWQIAYTMGGASIKIAETSVDEGNYNTATGYLSLYSNDNGDYNSAFGYESLNANTTGAGNSAFGYRALATNTTGNSNSAFGDQALFANTSGEAN